MKRGLNRLYNYRKKERKRTKCKLGWGGSVGWDECGINQAYSEEDYNADCNFMIDCLQWFLTMKSENKVCQPPLVNFEKRIHHQLIGDVENPFSFAPLCQFLIDPLNH